MPLPSSLLGTDVLPVASLIAMDARQPAQELTSFVKRPAGAPSLAILAALMTTPQNIGTHNKNNSEIIYEQTFQISNMISLSHLPHLLNWVGFGAAIGFNTHL